MRTNSRVAIPWLLGPLVAAAFAIVALGTESSEVAPLRWLSALFVLPGGWVLPWSRYAAPDGFKQLTSSDGPVAAYLWMLFVSFLSGQSFSLYSSLFGRVAQERERSNHGKEQMKFRFRGAHRLFIALQVVASLCALIITVPCLIILLAFLFVPGYDFNPSDMFHGLRRFFFRVFAGHTLRPLTLRTSARTGSSIRASGNTTT
jgi:hypothetical protein